MEEKKDKEQKLVIDEVKKCPYCKGKIRVRQYRKRLSKQVPAEFEEWVEIEEDKQKDLPGMGDAEEVSQVKVSKPEKKGKKG